MGLGGISVWQLLILLVIAIVLFGSKRIRHLGDDLGAALRGLKSGLRGVDETAEALADEQVKIREAMK